MNEPIDITPGGPIPPADPAAARRQRWIGLLAVAAVAAVVAGGVGYAALNQPVERRATVLPTVPMPAEPFDGGLPTSPAVPSAVPVVKSSSARPSHAPPSAKPAPKKTVPPQNASYSGGGRWRPDGLHRYRGSISLYESAEQATGWQVELTVPGGNPVRADGDVTVRQNGEHVVFAPGPDGADGFDFWIDGVLPSEPHDCLVDGHACV